MIHYNLHVLSGNWNSLPLGAQTSIVEEVNFKKTIKCVLLDRVLEEENSIFI